MMLDQTTEEDVSPADPRGRHADDARSQRMESLGRLAGGIAHDFNNMLAVIQNYADLVLDALRDRSSEALEVARDDIGEIRKAANRAASLTQQLLTFARQEVARPAVVDPNAIVDEVHKLLSRTIGEDIKLVVAHGKDVGAVKIDPGQLQQVILNLAVNARDAMPEGGTLLIETGQQDIDLVYPPDVQPGRYATITVTDTGQGMEPEVAERMFEPFFSTKERGRGTGLGLATVHGIAVQAGGGIHVYSEPGIGTSMKVLLPVTDEVAEPPVEAPKRSLEGTESILVVEDEAAIRDVIHRVLTRRGYTVILAASGDEAVTIAEDSASAIDLVVSDVVMPGLRAIEMATAIRRLRPEVPLIFMSGYAPEVVDSQGHIASGEILVQKPFSENELLGAIRAALS